MKLLNLTRPDGSPVWIVAAWVISVAPGRPDVDIDGHHTEIKISGGVQYVREAAQVVAMMLAE